MLERDIITTRCGVEYRRTSEEDWNNTLQRGTILSSNSDGATLLDTDGSKLVHLARTPSTDESFWREKLRNAVVED